MFGDAGPVNILLMCQTTVPIKSGGWMSRTSERPLDVRSLNSVEDMEVVTNRTPSTLTT